MRSHFPVWPWISKWDVSLVKVTRIHERFAAEFRCQALNVFNLANFELSTATNGGGPLAIGSSFGQTTSAFRLEQHKRPRVADRWNSCSGSISETNSIGR